MYKRISYRLTKPGSFNNLKQTTEEIPSPSPEEVTVSIKAIGLNFADVFTVLGLYKAAPKGSFIPGLEFSGEIIDTGASVTHLKKGDRVFGVTKFGAYTTCLNIDERYVIQLPEAWTYDDGAAFP
ncbi:MAG TPA: alcohol dehydrogenase catalytic domain-containing protein, partial [Cytophagaceae bacterium]